MDTEDSSLHQFSSMDKKYMFIRDIFNHKLQWTIKVNVTRDSGVQQSKDGKTTYRRVTLLDEKGTTIHSSFFGDEIKSFEDTLKCNKWYYITRGKLNKTKSEFSSRLEPERDVQLVLKKYTKIEEANVGEDGSRNMPVKKFNFLPLKGLPELSCDRQHIDNDKFPYPFVRRQFPVRLCFAMTINKVQGQTMEKVGIYLPQPVFSRGQLYVALSRAKRPDDIKILTKPLPDCEGQVCTRNVVYKDLLDMVQR